jgi:hypothetical protein
VLLANVDWRNIYLTTEQGAVMLIPMPVQVFTVAIKPANID